MARTKETRNRSKIGAPNTQIPIVVEQVGVQSTMQNPTSQNTIHTQNKHINKNNLSYNIIMNKSNLAKLTKDQLITLLLEKQHPVPKPRTKKMVPIPKPRQSVKQMVKDYENTIIKPAVQFRDGPQPLPRNNIIPPPIQFADKPKAAPRVKKVSFDNQLIPRRPIPLPRKKKMAPIPTQRTQITEVARAFKGYTKSYEVGIKNETDPLIQMSSTRLAIAHFMKQLLTQMKGIKFIETLTIYFEQQKGHQTVSRIGYFNSKPKTITNANDFQESLDANVEQIMNNIHKWISEGSAWIIKSINGHYINIIKYEPLTGSSYIKLPTELQHNKHGLINLQNKDNECFRWFHVRHLNPQIKDPQRIKKTDKVFVKQLNYDNIEFPVSVKQYNKVEIKLYQCQYAFQTYGHLLNEIKEIMRNGHFDRDDLTNKLTQNDDFILDNSPIIDKWGDKYDKKYQIFTYV